MKPAIALVDCNNFFVSCERIFRPDLAGQPVVVLSSNDGCVISRSNEAKAMGIAMGTPWFRLRDDPAYSAVTAFSSNFALYADMSNRIKSILAGFSPGQEAYSIDESFLDFSGLADIYERSYAICHTVLRDTAVPVCVGVGPTKTLAKLANHVAKKHPRSRGVFIYDRLTPAQKERILRAIPVGEVWGIGRQLDAALSRMKVSSAWDLKNLPAPLVRQRFGVTVERVVAELNEKACLELVEVAPPNQQMVSSRSFGVELHEKADIGEAISYHAAHLARELRAAHLAAGLVSVFIHTNRFRENAPQYHPYLTIPQAVPTNDTTRLIAQATAALDAIFKSGFSFKKAGVAVSELVSEDTVQHDLFSPQEDRRLMKAIDAINARFGQGTVRISSASADGVWAPKKDLISPRYTSVWDELPTAKS